jgi:hypothetical protein
MSGGNVLVKLFVPDCSVELGEPVAESQKVPARKLADGRFDLVNGTHIQSIIHLRFQGKRISRWRESEHLLRRAQEPPWMGWINGRQVGIVKCHRKSGFIDVK